MKKHGFLVNLGEKLIVQKISGYSVMDHTHIHPQFEIYFCPKNIAQKSIINGIEYNYSFPCAIISKPYSIHSMSCAGSVDSDFERYVIYFSSMIDSALDESFVPDIITDAKMGLLFELTFDQALYLEKLFGLFNCENESPITEREGALLISFFINRLFEFCKNGKITKVGNSKFYIQDVLRYIAENLSKSINVSEVAKSFAVSRSKLERDFRQATSRTPHEFIDMCRINQAKILLADKEAIPLSEISAMCGFASETYFFPFFQKHAGISPSEYRRRKLEEKKTIINKTKIETIN